MRFLSPSAPKGWSIKNKSLKSFVKEKFERKNSELLERDEWIDFGSMNAGSMADENFGASNSGVSTPADRKSPFWKYSETLDEHFDKIQFDGFDEAGDENRQQPRSTSKSNTPGGNSTKTVLQKWETFIRTNHGDENSVNKIEFDCTDEKTSRLHQRRSVGVLSSKSTTSKAKKERRSFGLGDITNQSVASKPTRGRRSFGLDDNNALFPTSTMEQLSTDISNLALQDSISKEEKTNPLKKSLPVIDQSHQASKRSTKGDENSMKTPEREAAASPDSDGSGFKKLLNMWKNNSPSQIQKSLSQGSPVVRDNEVKNVLNGDGDPRIDPNAIERDMEPRNAPDPGVTNSLVESNNIKANKLTAGGKQPMRALVILEQPDKFDLIIGEATQNNENEEQLVIQNLTRTTENIECDYSRSVFSGNEDLISFFLPQMGMACNKLIKPDEPTALENILRPWQVEFLKSFDIDTGEEFVKARRQSPSILARGLRQWRKKNDMMPFKTTSCAAALQIWSKVCKSYVRSIRRQTLAGQTNLGPADSTLVHEMTQFLGALPTAPKRRDRASNDALGIEPDSQVEV